MKKLLLTALVALCSFGANAQLVTSDAEWCDAIERAFKSQGITAGVNCDMLNSEKVLRVAVNGKTSTIPLVPTSHRDYSSTVYICVEPMAERHIRRDLDVRVWPLKDANKRVDEIYMNPADDAALYDLLTRTLGNVPRVKVIDPDYVNKARQQGVRVLKFCCNVLNMLHGERFVTSAKDAKPSKTRPAVERYFAVLEASMMLTDYNSGEIVWQRQFKADNNTSSTYTDPMESCRSDLSRTLHNAIAGLYPSTAPRPSVNGVIVKLETEKKEKAKTVFVNLGSANRVSKDDKFTVYRQFSVAGNSGKEKIGALTVSEVQGATLSLCKVKDGDKEIYAALQAGETLVVVSNW